MRYTHLTINKLRGLKRTDGAVLLMFALILPIFLSLCALAIDGPLVLIKKARLSDGLNEAVLAIAAVNNGGEDDAVNKKILKDYLDAYLDGVKIDINALNVTVDTIDEMIHYKGSAVVDVKTIFPMESVGLPSFGENVSVGNVGNVVKQATPAPADIALIIDFSRSMEKERIPDGSKSRIDMLREAVNEIIKQGLTLSGTQFAIVPYDIGVPVKVSGVNIAGGQNIGCSVQFVPKSDYKIDYQFWADKFVDIKNEKYRDPNYKYLYLKILWLMDLAMYDYYREVILPAISTSANPDMTELVNKGFCKKNNFYETGSMYGKALYSCWNADNSIYTNDPLITREYDNVIRNLKSMRSTKEKGKGYRSIMNVDSIDFAATFGSMFDMNKVITFVQPWAPNLQEHRAFGEMCQSAMNMTPRYLPNTEEVITEPDGYTSSKVTIGSAYKTAAADVMTAKQNAYLIPLTDNLTTLSLLSNMVPSGGTETMTGVMRAIPELAAGNNKRKVAVIISDGFDSDSYGNKSTDNLRLTREFMRQGLCTAIQAGFDKRGKSEKFSMYFISLSAADKNQEEIKLWSDCLGAGKVSTADDYQGLLSTLAQIMSAETGHFIN